MADGVRVAAVVKLMESIVVLPDKNCTERMDTPSAREFLTNLEPFQVVLLTIASSFTLIVYILALVHWYYVYSFVSIETRRNKLYWLVTLFPVSTGCCLVGMLAPRTSLIMTAVGILYYLMCLFVIVSLCRHLFGGRSSFSNSLQFESRPIDFRSPPLCCLIPFLPTAESSEYVSLYIPVVCNFVTICEMFVMCLLATVLLAPRRNAMFDSHRLLKTPSSFHGTEVSEIGEQCLGVEFSSNELD
ncbi:hypothetical protein NECAME_14170 [Necator americanus]|uniref:Uncharacterized protein n=1 Tax=Necator americanus TaxID=51031 RepID=W2SPU3_NECAM|nr:hypothetical protein NECAME_14170 [Necator americanus]ETN71548.1 hypothetical protein NECAME_14170 [Necator americanus]